MGELFGCEHGKRRRHGDGCRHFQVIVDNRRAFGLRLSRVQFVGKGGEADMVVSTGV
ncbi:hypothetical protein PBI_SHIFA_209 [Mycobacterium phage Shifa]|uniref:Uncharacterized protein n=1 Tax=Mycobacterium phage Shifa TaxID=2776849 RepID=A0A7M1CRL2_9CAUD|nr:hypothetical protein PBI_SHIFA_209 [Mycobacterium phage Shifa]